MQLLKNTKYKKKYESTISKIQNTKKIRTQNFKNSKYKEKTDSKISQRANPVFTFGNQEPKYKKIQNQPVVFSKPCSSDFVFLGCIFFVFFFCIFNIGRRPFCSHPGQLKFIELYLGLRRINQDYGSCTKTVR